MFIEGTTCITDRQRGNCIHILRSGTTELLNSSAQNGCNLMLHRLVSVTTEAAVAVPLPQPLFCRVYTQDVGGWVAASWDVRSDRGIPDCTTCGQPTPQWREECRPIHQALSSAVSADCAANCSTPLTGETWFGMVDGLVW